MPVALRRWLVALVAAAALLAATAAVQAAHDGPDRTGTVKHWHK